MVYYLINYYIAFNLLRIQCKQLIFLLILYYMYYMPFEALK